MFVAESWLTCRTITNWVREFEKWVPHMRVVPYYGEKACKSLCGSRQVTMAEVQPARSSRNMNCITQAYRIRLRV